MLRGIWARCVQKKNTRNKRKKSGNVSLGLGYWTWGYMGQVSEVRTAPGNSARRSGG